MQKLIGRFLIALLIVKTISISPTLAEQECRNHLVFIPGFLGSVLERDGEVIWGNRTSLLNFSKLRIVNGPRRPNDDVVATGVVKEIKILGPFKIEQYSHLSNFIKTIGYRNGIDYFEFPYDWRKSAFDLSKELQSFIDKIPTPSGSCKFDILAHSMGGLIGLAFMNERAGRHKIDKFITMGTPYYGSISAITTLVGGWGIAENLMAGGKSSIRSTTLSFPAFYELLPTYESCCQLGLRRDRNSSKDLNLLEINDWNRFEWQSNTQVNQKGLADALSSARKLRDYLPRKQKGKLFHKDVDRRLDFSTIGGVRIDTPFKVYFDPKRLKQPSNLIDTIIYEDGDGTVPFVHVSAKQGTSHLSFAKHQTVFRDQRILQALKRILAGSETSARNHSAQTVELLDTAGRRLPFKSLNLQLLGDQFTRGSEIEVLLSITSYETGHTPTKQESIQEKLRKFNPYLLLLYQGKTKLQKLSFGLAQKLSSRFIASDDIRHRAIYRLQFKAPSLPGRYDVQLRGLDNRAMITDGFVVLE